MELGDGHRSDRLDGVRHITTFDGGNPSPYGISGQLSKSVQVVAGGEGPAFAGHDYYRDLELIVEPPRSRDQIVQHGERDRVETVRPVENDVPDVTIFTNTERVEVHQPSVMVSSTRAYRDRMRLGAIFIMSVLTAAACAEAPSTDTTIVQTTATTLHTSAIATAYIDEALEVMMAESLVSSQADWPAIEDAIRTEAAGALTEEETHLAIELGLRLLNDPFGVFVSVSDVLLFEAEPPDVELPSVETLEGGVGFITAGQFVGDPGPEADAFAEDLAGQIVDLNPDVCGWVLDLRVTRFGIWEPVVGGLAPIIDRGRIGGFTHPDGRFRPLDNTGSQISVDDVVVVANAVPSPPDSGKPIAVLTGSLTGNPGEIAVVALKQQPDVHFVGQPTAGGLINIEGFELSDGSFIALATSYLTDRQGTVHESGMPLAPDTPTPNANASEQAAIDWLAQHPSCQ